jgi:hypothetical protein
LVRLHLPSHLIRLVLLVLLVQKLLMPHQLVLSVLSVRLHHLHRRLLSVQLDLMNLGRRLSLRVLSDLSDLMNLLVLLDQVL